MFFKKNFSPKNTKQESFLSIDIGTEYVKTAVYTIDGGEVNIIGYNRSKQKETTMYAAFIVNLQEALDTIDRSIGEAVSQAKELYGEIITLPKKAIIGIAGELVQGVTVVVNIERQNEHAEITKKEIDSVISKIKKQTFENTKEEISKEVGLKASQIVEIDTYINSVYVDGIRVTNPVGYKGHELTYRIFSTFAPKLYLTTIDQLAKGLNISVLKTVVEPYALSLGVKDLRKNDANAIIIDVGGGTTDVALVENGDIVGTKMFAIGGRVFTKRVQKELNLSYLEADDLKIDYSNGAVKNGNESVLRSSFIKDTKYWLKGVLISLEEFEDVTEYPSNILLCGGGALLPEIQEELISYPWMQFLNFKKHPKVDFVFPNHVNNVTDKTRSANLPMDVTPLALARMHLDLY